MRNAIDIIAVLVQTALVISSPALIAWVAYSVHPDLGLAGLGLGMIAGPFSVIKLFDFFT